MYKWEVLLVLNFDTGLGGMQPDCYQLSKGRMIVRVLNNYTPGLLQGACLNHEADTTYGLITRTIQECMWVRIQRIVKNGAHDWE